LLYDFCVKTRFLDENGCFFHISAGLNYPLQYLVAYGYFSEKSPIFFGIEHRFSAEW
jgi:hypothetical protein